jgi:hypothetical protein
VPEPTATPDAAAGFIDFSSAEGGFTARYPSDWFINDRAGFTTVASSEDLLDGGEPGDKGAMAMIVADDGDEFSGSDPVASLNTLLEDFYEADNAVVVEGPAAAVLNGQSGATAIGTGTSDSGTPFVAYFATLASGRRTVAFIGTTPAASESEFKPVFEAMVNSIEVGEPEATTTELPATEGFLLYGDTVVSAVTEAGPSVWSFIGIEGEVVDITVRPLDDELDAVVDLLDESGASLLEAELDDSFDTEQLIGFPLDVSGEIFISVRGFADSVGQYELTVAESGGAPMGGETFAVAGSLSYGDSVNSTIAGEAASVWAFDGTAGDVINITVEPLDDELDVVIDVLDASGVSVLANGEVDDSFGTEEIIGLNLPSSGSYSIASRGFAGSTGNYRLTVVEAGSFDGTGGQLAYGDLVDGSVGSEGASTWQFFGAEGDLIDITVYPFDEFDLVVDVLDASGLSMLPDGPVDLSFDNEYIRVLRLPDDGSYLISVTGYEGAVGDYELELSLSNGGRPGSIIMASDSLGQGDDSHAFPFTAASGELVSIQVQPKFDVVVSVLNDDTEELLEEVDDTTGFEELVFVTPADGNYFFEVSGFEGEIGDYDVTLLGSDVVLFELAQDDLVFGRLDIGGFIEYMYGGVSGEIIEIWAESGDEIDLVISVVDADGNVLAEVDDTLSGESEILSYAVPNDELVFIRINDFFDGEGDFTLSIGPG